jgi:cytochrome c peroxidase
MHHGGYPDLESVVDFYHHGGGAGLGLDVPHQTLPSDSLNLSAQQRKDLIAFMEALSGSSKD